jgi:hypothetical protein
MCVFSEQFLAMTADRCDVGQVSIDILPDDALLCVFDFYVAQKAFEAFDLYSTVAREAETWHTLVCVCRRWRTLVFASPHRLNLRIACTNKTPAREKLDVWPRFPIVVSCYCHSIVSLDNIKAALEHHDRVCQIKLGVHYEFNTAEVFAALEVPFPMLTDLGVRLGSNALDPILLDPVKFLGRSSHLRSLSFDNIPAPGLPELLLFSPNLVDLHLRSIPITGFISPDAMVTALSTLTRLETLYLDFQESTPRSHPDWEIRRLPPPTRTVLHSLIDFHIQSFIEYLDDFMARIDAPLLERLEIHIDTPSHLSQVIVLDTSHILRFISHVPKFQTLSEAHIGMDISNFEAWIKFRSTQTSSGVLKLKILILCNEPADSFPCLAQFCRLPFFPLPTLEYLYIDGGSYSSPCWPDYTEKTRWLELLQPFASVKNLYLSKYFAPHIAPALDGLGGEIVTEVLPTLENVFIEEFQPSGSAHEAIGQFVSERQLSGQPVVVSRWEGAEEYTDYR